MSYLWYWPAGGWNFDDWHASHPAPPITSAQSGRKDPLPLLAPGMRLDAWQKESAGWQKISDQVLGSLSDAPPIQPAHDAIGVEYRTDRYAMRRYRYRLTDEEWGFGWLMLPHQRKCADGVVLALHQTVPGGKNEVVGLEAIPGDHVGVNYAQELAQYGIAVFAPDAIAFGERQAGSRSAKYRSSDDFFAAQPHGSVMRKMGFDTTRAVDFLSQVPGLNARRFGCIGHSHGAYGTLFAMLADSRIECGVMSCGISLLRDDPAPDRWWRKTALIPRLGDYEKDITQSPIDFHHWLALVAPRPVMITGGLQDTIFPNQAALPGRLKMVQEVYGLYGAKESLTWQLHDGPHQFTESARKTAYVMLEAKLS
jgi:hypothetical protein